MVLSELLLQPSCPSHSYYGSTLHRYRPKMETYDHKLFSAVATTPENSSASSVNFPTLSTDSGHHRDHDHDHDHVDIQIRIKKLLMAYAEAIEMKQEELADVLAKCITKKTNLDGSPLERIALNLFQPEESQEKTYFFQESLANFNPAFRAFYDILPYGRFAHLTAGSAINEAVPADVDLVHIVDFDICEGIQWPPVIEAIAKIKKSLIITSIKLDQDQDSHFDQTRWNLCNFATSLGLDLKVQEIGMSQMVKKMDKRKLGSEFIVFNCMVGLLHMGRTRRTTLVMDFLKIARGALAKDQGIITFGGGLEVERTINDLYFSTFFARNLAYYEALYESIEWGLPSCFNEARIVMETLFVAPFVSSKSWFEKWDERRRENVIFDMNFEKRFGLEGERMSMESRNEAMEMVKEGETPYMVRIEGENGNEMVLEWKETPLVRVCVWKVVT